MQLQEEAKELDEKAKELEKEAQQLEKEAEEAYKNNDEKAIAEIEQKFEELDEEFQQIDDGFQEIDDQYQEIDEDFEELNKEFVAIDEELQEVFQDGNMPVRIPDEGPGFNEDNDVFNVPEDEQVDVNVEEFIQEEKQKVMEDNVFAEEANDFFENEEIQEMNVDNNVKDMFIINAAQIDQFIEGAGNNINDADDYYEQEDEMDDVFYVVDNNEELYNVALEADNWFDQFIADLAEDQNINVAPWLDMPNDVSVNENLAVNDTLGYVYGSDANGDQLTYSILSDPSGKLKIDGNRIYLDSAFSVTEDTTYNILLKVQDPYGASDVDEWQITVENNHSPVFSPTSTVSLAEDVSTGTSVATISAADQELETMTYSITAGNTGNAFTINSSTGAITTAAALDYETTTSYTLTITATDAFGNATTTTQTVNVTDVNEVISANDPSAWVTAGDGSAGAYKLKIGYTGTGDGGGMITELGHTAEAYNANNLSTYDVVVYYNSSNSALLNSPLSTSFTSWVNDGGVFVMYDRYVNNSKLDYDLPGHYGNVTSTRGGFSGLTERTYNIVDESTSNLLKYGPGGIHIDGNSGYTHAGNNHLGEFHLGGGGYTNHGYMSNLDSDVLGLATNDNSSHYVDAIWEYGDGAVYYSTTPLDHYIGSGFAENDAWDAYALNSLHYASSLIFDGYSVLNGTSSADKMYGTTGDDTFAPGTGSDEIWTGNGSDIIKYTALNQSDLTGDNDVIVDFNKDYDKIDISAITNGASISRTLTNNTLFKIDYNNDGTYDMQWDLDDYTGTADQVTVVT